MTEYLPIDIFTSDEEKIYLFAGGVGKGKGRLSEWKRGFKDQGRLQ